MLELPVTITGRVVTFNEAGESWHEFDLQNRGTEAITAIAAVVEYTAGGSSIIDRVPIIAMVEGTRKFAPPFASEAVLSWNRPLDSGMSTRIAASKSGTRTNLCPVRATVTYLMLRYSDERVQTLTSRNWQIGPIPRHIPRFPDEYPELPVVPPFSATATMTIDERGEVIGLAGNSEETGFVNWVREYMKKWSFHPAILNGQATRSELRLLFQVYSSVGTEFAALDETASSVTLVRFFPRIDVNPTDTSASRYVVLFGYLDEDSAVRMLGRDHAN